MSDRELAIGFLALLAGFGLGMEMMRRTLVPVIKAAREIIAEQQRVIFPQDSE